MLPCSQRSLSSKKSIIYPCVSRRKKRIRNKNHQNFCRLFDIHTCCLFLCGLMFHSTRICRCRCYFFLSKSKFIGLLIWWFTKLMCCLCSIYTIGIIVIDSTNQFGCCVFFLCLFCLNKVFFGEFIDHRQMFMPWFIDRNSIGFRHKSRFYTEKFRRFILMLQNNNNNDNKTIRMQIRKQWIDFRDQRTHIRNMVIAKARGTHTHRFIVTRK